MEKHDGHLSRRTRNAMRPLPSCGLASCQYLIAEVWTMTPQNNSAISQQTWDALNAHDIEKFKELLAEDCVYQSDVLPEPVRGRDAIGGLMQMYIGAFPDLRFTVERMHESGDHVITEWHGV